eukprot:m.16199 g.16199  ORF g.16199 m.16199 type:complete len:450 (+) comp5025_c0_seq1:106-1455(+)
MLGVLSLLPVVTGAPQGPRFSWDTLPVFFHSSNSSGPYTDEAIQMIASKFAMVTIEKFQGPCGYGPNASPACHQEDIILAELKKVKLANPNVSTIFYYNSVLDFPQYQLHARMLEDPNLTLHNAEGQIVNMSGGGHTCDVFDFGNPTTRQLFIETCANLTRTGYVDGCFVDRSVDGTPTDSGNDTVPSGRRYNLTNATTEAYFRGHIQVLKDLQAAVGDGPVVANHAYGPPHDLMVPGDVSFAMDEFFSAGEESIQTLMLAAQNGRGIQAHGKGSQDDLATFLIGAGYRAYYGMGGWSGNGDVTSHWMPAFDEPLGAPHGPASKSADGVYSRKFGVNVTVTFDTKTNKGTITNWGNFPSPPPTAPPSPPPPVHPTAQCPTVASNCAYQDDDVGTSPGPAWTDCCAQCAAKRGCVRWTWREENAPEFCHLHGSNSKHAVVAGAICGTVSS